MATYKKSGIIAGPVDTKPKFEENIDVAEANTPHFVDEKSEQQLPKIYTLKDIEKVVSSESFQKDLINEIEVGFLDLYKKKFNSCPIQTMGAPPLAPFATTNSDDDDDDTMIKEDDKQTSSSKYAAQTCVKSGYVTGEDHYVIKVASGGFPFKNSGLLQIFSQKTGKLEAILLDEGILTEHRTAAAGAVAAKYLAPKNVGCIGIIGTGTQARYQLQYLEHITKCRCIMIWGRDKKHANQLKYKILERGYEQVTLASNPDWMLEMCDIIVTTTSSREAILGKNRIPSRKIAQHINCIGADSVGKQELSLDLLSKNNTQLHVCDSKIQTTERGEFQKIIASGKIDVDNDIVEIGQLIAERDDLQRSTNFDDRRTIFDSSGVAIQDCVIAKMVHNELQRVTAQQEGGRQDNGLSESKSARLSFTKK